MTIPGESLTEADYRWLESSWISRAIADAAMLRRVTSTEGAHLMGRHGRTNCAGILFPYLWPGEKRVREYRIRRDEPDMESVNGRLRPKAKYLSPPGARSMLYFPPAVLPKWLALETLPIVIGEGEKKTLALWRLAWHERDTSEIPRFLPIGIAGVWNWRGTIGKESGPNGERLDVKGPISDLDHILWDGRSVYLLFDANVHVNKNVLWARSRLTAELARRGALVYAPEIPNDAGVNGIDDFLNKYGPEAALVLLDSADANRNGEPCSVQFADDALALRFPFIVTIPPEERDKNLREKLRAEWGAILHWMIAGCLQWQREGLNPPPAVRDATNEYMRAEDSLARWIEERCLERTERVSRVADLFTSWKQWAEASGEHVGSEKRFSERLEARGFKKGREGGTGRATFRGIAIL